jgi:hypothetical protein
VPGKADYFFPDATLTIWNAQYVDAPRIYYGLFLTAMHEPSLSCGAGQPDTYRLTRLEYTGVPVAVRVSKRGSGLLTWTKLEAPTWMLPPGRVLGTGTVPVSDAAWKALETAIDASGYWQMPTNEKASRDDPSCVPNGETISTIAATGAAPAADSAT